MTEDGREILIAGYFGFGNAGDEAILSGMLNDLNEKLPDAKFTIISGNPEHTKSFHHVEAIHYLDIYELCRVVQISDLILLGGGGLFHDYWPVDTAKILTPHHNGFSFYAGIPLLAEIYAKPCMLYALGVGPLESAYVQQQTLNVVDLFQKITVRDEESLGLLNAICADDTFNDRIHLSADPAFNCHLARVETVEERINEFGIEFDQPTCGVSLRYWDFGVEPSQWEREVAQALDLWIYETSGQVLFLPMQHSQSSIYEDDLKVSDRILSLMSNKESAQTLLLNDRPDILACVFAHCSVSLSMRMHAVLFSLLSSVPPVALSYDPKVSSLMRRAKIEELCLPKEMWQANRIMDCLRSVPQGKDEIGLYSFVQQMRSLAKESANLAALLLGHRSEASGKSKRGIRELARNKIHEVIELKKTVNILNDEVEHLSSEIYDLKRKVSRYQIQSNHFQEQVEYLNVELHAKEQILKQVKIDAELERKNAASLLKTLRDQREQLQIERDELRRSLSRLRNTIGVRLLGVYWDLASRIIPVGSRRRMLYRRFRSGILAVIRSINRAYSRRKKAAMLNPTNDKVSEYYSSNYSTSSLDHNAGLLHFVEQVVDRGISEVTTIISPTSLVSSEGQRSTNIALELIDRGHAVVFAFWRWRKDDKYLQDRLEENIYQIPIDAFIESPEAFFQSFDGPNKKLLLIEFPYPELFESIAVANAAGWITLYDVVDDWKAFSKVGQAAWYDEQFEKHLLTSVDCVTAVNKQQVGRVLGLGYSEAAIVPNGVVRGIDNIGERKILERGEITLGYFGYLSDAWFDWELVRNVGMTNPSWRVYIIGYGYRPPRNYLPENVILLGKKPQNSLAAFANNWDVGIIPFKRGAVAQGSDPIKTYEYLAMGLPVVATGVCAPQGGEGFVRIANGLDEFTTQVINASEEEKDSGPARRHYAEGCTWANRVETLLDIVNRKEQRIGEKVALFEGEWNA